MEELKTKCPTCQREMNEWEPHINFCGSKKACKKCWQSAFNWLLGQTPREEKTRGKDKQY